jgi:hypothetical protein
MTSVAVFNTIHCGELPSPTNDSEKHKCFVVVVEGQIVYARLTTLLSRFCTG